MSPTSKYQKELFTDKNALKRLNVNLRNLYKDIVVNTSDRDYISQNNNLSKLVQKSVMN